MASATSPRGAGGRKGSLQHQRSAHHLSSRRGGEHEGWAEGIASLTERHAATALLDDAATEVSGNKASCGKVRVGNGCCGRCLLMRRDGARMCCVMFRLCSNYCCCPAVPRR